MPAEKATNTVKITPSPQKEDAFKWLFKFRKRLQRMHGVEKK
jgi:hypothetical protein